VPIRRRLLIGAVGLVRGKVSDDGKAMASVCDELEPHLASERFLQDAPFDTISLVIRYGAKESLPKIGRINKQHSELEVVLELPMAEMRAMDYGQLKRKVMTVTLDTLISVGDEFGLPSAIWNTLREP
jgi:hypothetical protein